jgi:hypothetical protein
MPKSKKQADALQLVLIEAALDFARKPQTSENRELLVAKLVSLWTIRHEVVEAPAEAF